MAVLEIANTVMPGSYFSKKHGSSQTSENKLKIQ